MNTELRKSLLWSFFFHALILIAFIKLYDSFLVVRTPLLMELTLIGQMSRGDGFGSTGTQAGETSGALTAADTGRGEFDSPSRVSEVPTTKRLDAGEVSVARTPVTSSDAGTSDRDRYLESVRNRAPIGIDPKKDVTRRIKTTTGLGSTGIAGSPTGNADIEGQLSARGIKRKVFPSYPDWAKRQGVEGTVKYRISVLPNGLLRDNAALDQTSGYREMDKIVYDALIQWEFEPLPPEVGQVEQEGVITFIFNFKTGVTSP